VQLRTAGQAAAAAREAVQSYRRQAEEIAGERAAVETDLDTVRTHLAEARADLAAAFLPDAGDEAVAHAVQATGAAHLTGLLHDLRAAHERDVQMLARLEGEPEYIDRDLLLSANSGTLAVPLAEAQGFVRDLEPRVKRFEKDASFQLVLRSEGKKPASPAMRLLGRILLVGFVWEWTRRSAEASVLKTYGVSTTGEAVAQYRQEKESLKTWQGEAARLQGEVDRVRGLVKDHDGARARIEGFPADSLAALRAELRQYLDRCEDFAGIRERAGEGARVAVTSIIAMQEKEKYLRNMSDYLRGEVLQRQQQANKIDSVGRKWARNPGKRMSADKSGWLVTGPARKAESTRRTVTHIHTMRSGIVGYDDYYAYDRMLDVGTAFLAWDVFSRLSEDRMPGDSFAAQVFPDVAGYREEHGAADFAMIDGAADYDDLSGAGDLAAAALAADSLDGGDIGEATDGHGIDDDDPDVDDFDDGDDGDDDDDDDDDDDGDDGDDGSGMADES
jgi:hypothetical protein